MPSKTITFWLSLSLAGLLALAAYWPGIYGGFLFDDYATLPALGKFGPVDNWLAFWRYITSGGGDPTGRPLAMLSFLIDAHDWPTNPLPFKVTNIILHIINGAMLMALLRALGLTAFDKAPASRINLAAVLAGSYWLLQPFFVSTTLYAVQRETMLSACFVLLGLLSWLQGRCLLFNGKRLRGLLWIVFGLVICTILAVLSKANGVLLPAFVLCIEYSFLHAHAPAPASSAQIYKRTMFLLASLPTASIAIYLVYQGWNGFVHGVPPARTWTLGQRLLTEPRILIIYLKHLWLPQPFTSGLFNDQIPASTSLWSPITTLPAILGVLILVVAACWNRKHRPAIALAILFYFFGQTLESSTIPLELYFEHRNYIPALTMYWPLSLWLCDIPLNAMTSMRGLTSPAPRSGILRIAKPVLAIFVLLSLAWMTYIAATLWGNTKEQAILWATLNPDSARAQTYAAIEEMNTGHASRAVIRLKNALAKNPQEAQLALNLFIAECSLGHVDVATIDAARNALHTMADNGPLLLNWFDREIAQSKSPACPELNLKTLRAFLDAAQANPRLMSIYGRRQDIYHLRGQLALTQENAALALQYFNKALDQQADPKTALNQAALLGAAGFPKEGLAHLDYYENRPHPAPSQSIGMLRIHAWLLQRQRYWPKELTRLRATLSSDALRTPEN